MGDSIGSSMSDKFKRLSLTSSRAQESDIMSVQLSQQFTKIPVRPELLLHESAIKNDVHTCKKLIEAKVDINSKTHMERTPIHWAICHQNVDIVLLLLQANCDIEAFDKLGMRPVMMAAMVGNNQIVELLVKTGCNCRVVNKKDYTVLHCAVKHDQSEIVMYLLDNVKDLDINAIDKLGQTSLHMASINNNLEVVDKLISCGADLNIKDKQGRHAGHWAAFKGHDEVLTALIKSGIEIDDRDDDGKTALHLAAEYGFRDASQTLIQHNCDIFATDSKGRSALMIASALGYVDVVALLVSYGAVLNSKDKNGNTALHLCVLGNHVKMTQFLIDKGAQINSLNNRLQTPLVVAAEIGHTEVAEILIKNGADLDVQEKSGRTALYVASRGSFQAIVDMLIKAEREKFFKLNQKPHQSGNQCNDRLNNCRKETFDSDDCTDIDSNHCGHEINHNISLNQFKKILWNLSRNHLEVNDWKRLAKIWDFTEDQMKAIEHQYTGKTSYKDHCYRMMVIWLHSLPASKNPLHELYDALCAINRREVAEKVRKKAEEGNIFRSQRFGCHCLPGMPANLCHYCCIS
ncbi:ankyrin repeat and death domain-containing protein 1A-like [Oppia nitens]|uniref:ankyrin repeat and death domain-containing protein 1A-like n=1 Tax=Oppia nitens TaxID=1686743 RepID=UPI0023DAE079|nr:ankyrin repeat and death domain-containing protein 1A-like [Oppia nitens]